MQDYSFIVQLNVVQINEQIENFGYLKNWSNWEQINARRGKLPLTISRYKRLLTSHSQVIYQVNTYWLTDSVDQWVLICNVGNQWALLVAKGSFPQDIAGWRMLPTCQRAEEKSRIWNLPPTNILFSRKTIHQSDGASTRDARNAAASITTNAVINHTAVLFALSLIN